MTKIRQRELDQGFGIAKTIYLISIYAIFIASGYYLIEKTYMHSVLKMGIISLIGTILVGVAFLGLKIMEKLKDYLETKVFITKEEREEKEDVNIPEEPQKKKLTEKLKSVIPKKKEAKEVDTLNAPKTVVKTYENIPEVPQEPIPEPLPIPEEPPEDLLPIETPIPKLPIEEE